MKPIPTAKQLLKDNFLLIEEDRTCEAHTHLVVKQMIEFAKLHVKKALETALEEVPYGGSDEVRYEDVKGILTCYPLTNIK